VKARAVPRQGIRPDTLLLIAQFDHWATPFAKDFGVPSLNRLAQMDIGLTDATGSGADIVRVSLKKTGPATRARTL
jgi:phenylacetyl-CoA:acceptor oxidoreductase